MAKSQASLPRFFFHMESEEKADDDQDQESDDSDRQDVQVVDRPDTSELEPEHSCHNPSHIVSTLRPYFLVISWPLK